MAKKNRKRRKTKPGNFATNTASGSGNDTGDIINGRERHGIG